MLQREGMASVVNKDLVQERPDEDGPPLNEVQGELKSRCLAAFLVVDRV